MNEITIAIVFMGALIFCSHLFNNLFDKIKIPNVLLLLIIGIIVGFFVDAEAVFGSVGRVFTTITLVVIMFESGANLKFVDIKKAITSASLITIFNFITTLILVSILVKIFMGMNWISAIFFGAIVGGTSSAVVIPMVKQLKLGDKGSTILVLESAISDVLCLVVGMAALEGMKAGAIEIGEVLNSMWKTFLFAALIGVAAGFVWSVILDFIRGIKNSMFTSFAFVFILYGVVEMMGFNGGIASLCFGIIVGNAESYKSNKVLNKIFRFDSAPLSKSEKNFFSEIVFILQTYFFVYVGMSIQFGNPLVYVLALALVVLIILVRPLGIKMFVRTGVNTKETTMMSILSPKGLITAVLASIPLQLGLDYGDKIMELGYAMVLISIVVCSILVILVNKDPFIFKRIIHGDTGNKDDGINKSDVEVVASDVVNSTNEISSDEIIIDTHKKHTNEETEAGTNDEDSTENS